MRTIAIVNQKGGCGKTTTAINLSAYLALKNRKVLLIDLDPQSHASIGLNINVENLEMSVYDIFSETNKINLDDVIVSIDDNFDLAPSQLILSAVEQELAGKMNRDSVMLSSINTMQRKYNYIIIDCPPSFGLLSINALRACSEALVPIEMSVFSLQGVARLFELINILKVEHAHEIRPKALATDCNPRTLFANEVLKNIDKNFGKSMYQTLIHSTVKLKEAASFGVPISKYNKNCRGAEDYRTLANEIIAEEKKADKFTIPIQLGPKQYGKEVTFRYYDSGANDVKIAGDFSNWQPAENIMRLQSGIKIWKGTVKLEKGSHEYKFIVDGEWKTDPYNPEKIKNENGVDNSLLIVSD